MSKTTIKDFELFKKECKKWIKFFGLKEWRVEYILGCDSSDRAQVRFNNEGRTAYIYLTDELDLNNYQIRESAFHEVCELLLADPYHYLVINNVDKELINTMTHTIIRRLENSVFK